jgi:general secretion pathway protein K
MSSVKRSPSYASTRGPKGAALLAVLIVAVVMVVLLGVASKMLEGRLSLAEDSQAYLQGQARLYAKANELVYLFATERQTAAGLSQGLSTASPVNFDVLRSASLPYGDELRTDGYIYTDEQGMTFFIQNQEGLLPINSSSAYWLKKWLKSQDYSRVKQSQFADTLADYADADKIRRAAGGEKLSYQGETGPRDFLLQSCSELWLVTGWDALLNSHTNLLEQCSLRRGARLNLNAVPLSLWQVLWPNTAEKLKTQRQQGHWFRSERDILALEPSLLTVPEDYYSYLGGAGFRLHLLQDGAALKMHIQTGRGANPAFVIKYE